jgi:hypothetical protein
MEDMTDVEDKRHDAGGVMQRFAGAPSLKEGGNVTVPHVVT